MGMDLEEVMRKAHKLMAFKDGNANPNEVAIAAGQLKRLLRKYQLSIADIKHGDLGEDVIEEDVFTKRNRENRAEWFLLITLCDSHQCTLLIGKSYSGKIVYSVIGAKSDVVHVTWLYESLLKRFKESAKDSARAAGFHGHGITRFVNSFITGAAVAIGERLIPKEETEVSSDSRALAVVKSGAITGFLEKKYPELKRAKPKEHNISSGLGAKLGYREGMQVPLSRGVENKEQAAQLTLCS